MEFPIEILFRVASFCKYYKTLSNLLLVSKDLREYIEAYPKCKEKLKNQVCENVNEILYGGLDISLGDSSCAHYISFHILPNKLWYGEHKMSLKPFTENSSIESQCFLKDGVMEGESKRWYGYNRHYRLCFHEDGGRESHSKNQIYHQCFYKNDMMEGESKKWWCSGQLYYQCFYKNGKREGEYKSWHENGQPWMKYFYKDGKISSITPA